MREEVLVPINFFEQLNQVATQISEVSSINQYFSIGSETAKVIFAGDPSLENCLGSALSHLQLPPKKEDLTIYCWSNQAPFHINLPFLKEDYQEQGLLKGFNNDRFYAAFQHGAASFVFYDRQRSIGYYLINTPEQIPYWEQSFPFKNIFHWRSEVSSLQLLHAASVAANAKAVLISGNSGSGKSSTTLSCALAGMDILGDDYVLADSEKLRAYSLYGYAKINLDNRKRFPSINSFVAPVSKNQEKALVSLNTGLKGKLISNSPLKAHLVPVITNSTVTTFELIGKEHGMRNLTPSTMFQLPGLQKETFQKCSLLTKGLPTYKVHLGSDPLEVGQAIAAFVTTL
ncbi:hypothetical protein [Algivirga pacifica]|uniref:Serine kinase n=1 Tax=Algivirga pacifica TaxID=1162670 RepID=A0ABP9DB85_9BACT